MATWEEKKLLPITHIFFYTYLYFPHVGIMIEHRIKSGAPTSQWDSIGYWKEKIWDVQYQIIEMHHAYLLW